MQHHGEKAQATVWMVAALMVAMTVSVYLTRMAVAADRQSSAQSAADVAALAGVSGGRDAAQAVAERNGASIVEWSTSGGSVTVSIRRGEVVASASAAPNDGGGELDGHRCCLDSGGD